MEKKETCIVTPSEHTTNTGSEQWSFGVMSAIGASASSVRRIVVGEGISLAASSCVVAIVLALLFTVLMDAGVGNLFLSESIPFRFSTIALLTWIVGSVLGVALATLAPAFRASRLTVREALAYL